MTSKSVVFIMKMFPRLSETFILNEILALEAQGLKIRIISLYKSDSKVVHQQTSSVQAKPYYLDTFWKGLPSMLRAHVHFLVRYPRRWLRAYTLMLLHYSIRSWKWWFQAARVAQFLEETDATHIHAHFSTAPTTVAIITSILLGLPSSFTCHAKDVYAGGRLHSPAFHRNLNKVDFVICVSEQTKQDILDAWSDVPPQKIHVIYNGLDLERFRYRSVEPRERLILSVGRLVEKKGFSYLIEACQLLKKQSVSFKCEIVGYGEMQKRLIGLISAKGLEDRVQLIGPLSQQELMAYYQRADVFCLPTIIANNEDRDVLPNVVKEAMAIGVPLVTTDIPAMEELVDNGRTGLVVSQKNSQALAEALALLLNDKDLGRHLAANGRRMIEKRFDRDKNVSQLRQLFEQSLGSSPTLVKAELV